MLSSQVTSLNCPPSAHHLMLIKFVGGSSFYLFFYKLRHLKLQRSFLPFHLKDAVSLNREYIILREINTQYPYSAVVHIYCRACRQAISIGLAEATDSLGYQSIFYIHTCT